MPGYSDTAVRDRVARLGPAGAGAARPPRRAAPAPGRRAKDGDRRV
ncbi:hypothetical protein [Streptomyces sp. NPDC002785]